jgi:hypothetical protein
MCGIEEKLLFSFENADLLCACMLCLVNLVISKVPITILILENDANTDNFFKTFFCARSVPCRNKKIYN